MFAIENAERIARRVLAFCNRNRIGTEINALVFGLFARLISSAPSVCLLVRARKPVDALVVSRTMLDATIDIHYLLHDPSLGPLLMRLFKIEYAIDWEYRVRARARARGISAGAELNAAPRDVREVVERARRDPLYGVSGKAWPKQWRYISADEKLKAIRQVGYELTWIKYIDYLNRIVADAAVHGRPIIIETMFIGGTFTASQKLPPPLNEPVHETSCAVCCLLASSMAIAESYHLPDRYREDIDKAGDLFAKLAKPMR